MPPETSDLHGRGGRRGENIQHSTSNIRGRVRRKDNNTLTLMMVLISGNVMAAELSVTHRSSASTCVPWHTGQPAEWTVPETVALVTY
jgi:hypothetical protein